MKGNTLTKRDLAVRIADESGIAREDAMIVLQKSLDYISEALAQGKRVEFREFGVFSVCIRKSRVGRNPRKPQNTVRIPDRKTVKFKAGRKMKADVLAGAPSPSTKPEMTGDFGLPFKAGQPTNTTLA